MEALSGIIPSDDAMPRFTYQNYEQFHQFTGKITGQTIPFFSKPALSAWDCISPSAALLAEAVQPKWDDKILLIGCGHGALAVILARQVAENHLTLLDSDQVALNCAEQTLRLNGITHFNIAPEITLLPHAAGSFSIVALDIPKGRSVTRRWLVEAYELLLPGGSLYLAGANDLGIQSAIKDAQALFGNATILGYKKGNRCALARKEQLPPYPPAWAQEPGTAPGTWLTFDLSIKNIHFLIHSLPGVFSFNRLDEGTELLLEAIQFPDQSEILDVGCGFGIIGLYAASQASTSSVDLIDSNRLAVAAAVKNRHANQIQNARVLASDLLEGVHGKRYHLIVSNPPFHTGKEVNYAVSAALLRQAHRALLPEGQLVLVANRFIRYDYLLQEVFGNAQVCAQNNRYHVLSAVKHA